MLSSCAVGIRIGILGCGWCVIPEVKKRLASVMSPEKVKLMTSGSDALLSLTASGSMPSACEGDALEVMWHTTPPHPLGPLILGRKRTEVLSRWLQS